jgi:hypothetical protein
MELKFTGGDQKEKKAEIITKAVHNGVRANFLGHPYRIPYSPWPSLPYSLLSLAVFY